MDELHVDQILDDVENLPSMPAVAVQVLQLAESEESTLDDFAAALLLDPALAGRILSIANSSLYCHGDPVQTLQRAVMTLGLKSVRLLALSFSLVHEMPRESAEGFDYRGLWRRTITCAAAAHTFGTIACRSLVDEAFLCGLLSRVGQLVLATGMAEKYADVIAHAEGAWPTPQVERSVLGFDSDRVGAALLRSWSVPDLICDAVRDAHDTGPIPESPRSEPRELRRLVRLGHLCEEFVCGTDEEGSLGQLVESAEEYFGLGVGEVEDCLRQIEGRIAETADMLEVEMRPVRMDEILRQARKELLNESLAIATGMEQVERVASQIESSNRELRAKVHRDSLTGIANRRCFDENLERCIENHRSGDVEGGIGLLMIDIDKFKSVNDEYGHPIGDRVLQFVATKIATIIRERDLVARYGGEEFAVVFGTTTREGLEGAAERVRAGVASNPVEVDGHKIQVTVSVGASYAPMCDERIDAWTLVSSADNCLYQAKREGRNRCCTMSLDRP